MKLLLLLLAALLAPVRAQERFESLGVSDGLGNRKVYQVCQDADGYLWFYTQGSIDRYDGFEFRHYILGREATEGEYLATSNTLALDGGGVVNVVQTNGRVYRYNRDSDAIEPAFTSPGGILYAVLYRGAETWLGTSLGLVCLQSGQTLLEGMPVLCLASEGDRIWAGTDAGVYECSEGECRKMERMPSVQVTALLPSGDGTLFAGTFSDGAYSLDTASGQCRRLPSSFPQVPVRKIIRDGARILFGTDGAGVVIYDPEAGVISGSYMDGDSGNNLCANTVSDICIDRDGILWAATTTNGVSFLDRSRVSPKWVRHIPGDPSSLVSDHVNTVLQDSRGRIWFGTNKGLSRLDGGRWRNFNIPGADVILMLSEDGDGNVWAAGYGFPLLRIDPSDKVSVPYPDRFHYTFSLACAQGCLWVGDLNEPLTCISLSSGIERTYPEDSVWDLYPRDGMWVASHSGLGRIPTGGDTIEWLSLPADTSGAWCITSDPSGLIWAGMEHGGILSYDPATSAMRTYNVEGTVFAILPEGSGVVWAVSGEYIYRLDSSRGVPVIMNRFLGIGRGEFNHTAAARLSDGRLVFGTADGALVFDPSAIDYGEMGAVTPAITSFRLLSGDSGKVLKGRSPNALDGVTLSWQQRSFGISYSALHMTSQARILFEYKMEGYDTEPHRSLSAGSVEYSGMRPGRYVFRVDAVDALTGSVLGSKSLTVRVRRPVLLSIPALLLYAILAAAGIILLVRYRRGQRQRQITRERMDTFIRFAHELKTPVSLIKGPLSALDRDSSLPEQDREAVSTALRNTDRLMDMINGLLDLRDENSQDKRLALEPCDLRDYIGETLNTFLPAARHKGISVTYSVDEGLGEVPIDRAKMDHILHNLFSNAVKYTEQGSVTVSARAAGRMWKLMVQDTGIGIPAEVRSRIFYGGIRAANARNIDETGYGIGLMITRQLVLQHRGSISLDSEEGTGTTFTLQFPLEYRPSAGVMLMPDAVPDSLEEAPEATRRELLLIVEDDAEMLRYLRELLSADFDIRTASDGESAIRQAEEEQPSLVLSDVVMPGMNGYELCRHLKSSLPTSHIPVILLTAMDDREHVILGLESGADDYVVKPFDPQVLQVRISNLLHERERLRELVLSSGRKEKQREYTNRLDKEFMEKVLTLVEASCSDSEFQIDDLCRSMAMSRTAFFNKLKALTGKAPGDFIRIYRLEKARKLLETGEYTITEVADSVGFSDAKYFSSCFKKAFGVSPSKY